MTSKLGSNRKHLPDNKFLISSSSNCGNCNARFSPTNRPVKKFLAGFSSGDAGGHSVSIWKAILEILNWEYGTDTGHSENFMVNLPGYNTIDKSMALCSICGLVIARFYCALKFFKTIENCDSYLGKYITRFWKLKSKGQGVRQGEDDFDHGYSNSYGSAQDDSHFENDDDNDNETKLFIMESDNNDDENDMDYEDSDAGVKGTKSRRRTRIKDPAPDYELFKEAPPAAAQKTEVRVRPYLCSLCGSGFDKQTNLKRHLLLSHNEGDRDKVFMCDDCGKCYYFAYLLKNHQKVHSEDRPFACDEEGCNLRFKTKLSVSHHKDAVHRKIKRYSCSYCAKEFRVRRDWRWHEEFVHRAPKGKKFFQCEFGCGCSYRRKHSVQHHQRRCPKNPNPGSSGSAYFKSEDFDDVGPKSEESENCAVQALVQIEQSITLYTCSRGCGKAYSTLPELQKHDQYHCPKLFVQTSGHGDEPGEGETTTVLVVSTVPPDSSSAEDEEDQAETYEVEGEDNSQEIVTTDGEFQVDVSEEVVEVEYYTI